MKIRHWLAALTTLLPAVSMAHPGHDLQAGFVIGALHPLTGLDHLLAMLAVGLWAAQLCGRLRFTVPLSFVSLMLIAAVFGMSGSSFNAVEQGIAASVCVLGLLLATSVRLPAAICLILTGAFAMFHGYAHGVEVPQEASAALYMTGFATSTLVLHVISVAAGRWLTNHQQQTSLRWAGAAMAASGATLWVGQALA